MQILVSHQMLSIRVPKLRVDIGHMIVKEMKMIVTIVKRDDTDDHTKAKQSYQEMVKGSL